MENCILFGRVASLRFETPPSEASGDTPAVEAQIISLTNEQATFECNVQLDNTNNSNKATISIYNLPANIKNLLKKNTKVTITAGYEGENCSGTVFFGVIEKYKDSKNNEDIKTEITCTTANDEMKENKIKLSFPKNSKASSIINTVIKNTDLKNGEIKLGKDTVYERGRTLNGNVKKIFTSMARETQSRFYISNRIVYFYPIGEIKKEEIQLITGSILTVEETDEGWKINTVLDHRIEEGVWVIIDYQNESLRQDIKGKFEVVKVNHRINAKQGDHKTEMEILTKIKEEEKAQVIKINGQNKKRIRRKRKK